MKKRERKILRKIRRLERLAEAFRPKPRYENYKRLLTKAENLGVVNPSSRGILVGIKEME